MKSRIMEIMDSIEYTVKNGVTYINGSAVYVFRIYIAPDRPTDNATYFGSTPVFEQCKGIVEALEDQGQVPLVKCIVTGGMEKWLYF